MISFTIESFEYSQLRYGNAHSDAKMRLKAFDPDAEWARDHLGDLAQHGIEFRNPIVHQPPTSTAEAGVYIVNVTLDKLSLVENFLLAAEDSSAVTAVDITMCESGFHIPPKAEHAAHAIEEACRTIGLQYEPTAKGIDIWGPVSRTIRLQKWVEAMNEKYNLDIYVRPGNLVSRSRLDRQPKVSSMRRFINAAKGLLGSGE